MKNLSKVLAVVLAFAMVLSMVSFAAFTDLEDGAPAAEAVSVLSALDILKGYPDGSFKPDATITRAEFAAVVIRSLGLADTASGGATIFTDVAADHWANGVIALAAQQGIVNGYGDGRFGPEDPVKYEEAIKMVVASLGYTPMADANGGYPGGYQVVAAQKGILARISGAKVGQPASRGVVAQLAYNSLTVPLMEQTGYGTQTNFQTVSSLLLDKLGVKKFEGIVTGTSLSSNLKDGKVDVTFNYQIMGVKGEALAKKFVPGTASGIAAGAVSDATPRLIATGEVEAAAKDLIDVASILYVKDADTDDAKLVCILKDGNKNETVSFMTEDLKSSASLSATAEGTIEVYTDADAGEYEEYTLNVTKVYVNGRTSSVETASGVTAGSAISADADFKAIIEYYLDPAKSADVTMLSQVEDEFNVIYITTYLDVLVDRIASRTYKISYTNLANNTTGSVTLDEEKDTLKFEIFKDGKKASFADIEEDDVLSIAGYISGGELKYGKVYIISDKIEGKVTAKSATAGKIAVDGTTYDATPAAANAVSLGDTAVFFINNRGVLVGCDTTATAASVQYGFATYIRKYDADYGEPAQIRILTAENKWKTFEMADTISINGGARIKSKDIVWTTASYVNSPALALISGSNTKYGVNEVIAYDTSSDGKISKLYFKDTAGVFENEGITPGSLRYDADTAIIGDIFLDTDTAIFSLADYTKYAVRNYDMDEDDVAVVTLASLADGAVHAIKLAFDYDDSGIAGAIVGQGIAAGIDYAANFFVVTDDALSSTNEAGEEGVLLTGIQGGEKVTIFINTEEYNVVAKKAVFDTASDDVEAQLDTVLTVTDTTFGKGDVLLYTLDSKDEVAKLALLVDASDVTSSGVYGSYLDTIDGTTASDTTLATFTVGTTTYKFVFGYAKEILRNGNLVLLNNALNTEKTYAFASDATGTLYDAYKGTGKVLEAMTGDITADSDADATAPHDGDVVFARVTGSRVSEYVIFANYR